MDLVNEYQISVRGPFFAEGFQKLGQSVAHRLPSKSDHVTWEAGITHQNKEIRFNTRGFLGKLDCSASSNTGCGTGHLSNVTNGPGKGALLFVYFLAMELVRIDKQHVEEWYIPTSGIGENTTEFEEVMNAFVHYAYQASHWCFIFADLQGIFILLQALTPVNPLPPC